MATVLALGAVVVFAVPRRSPPSLLERIPFVFNTIQFVFSNQQFMSRAMWVPHCASYSFYYASHYSLRSDIQTIFARSHKVGSEAIFEQNIFPILYRMSKEDIRHFAQDKSGRGRRPAPGIEHLPPESR